MNFMARMRAVILATGQRQLSPLNHGVNQRSAEQWATFRREFPAVHPSRAAELAEEWATRLILRGRIKCPPKGCRTCPVPLTPESRGHWVPFYCADCEVKAIRAELDKLNVTFGWSL